MQITESDILIEESKLTQYYCKFYFKIWQEKKIPIKVCAYNNSQINPIITIELDAVDFMCFGTININNLDIHDAKYVLQSLKIALDKFGGRCLFKINKQSISLVREYLGLNLSPSIPDESFINFRNLLYFSPSQNQVASDKFKKDAQSFIQIQDNFKVISNDQDNAMSTLFSLNEKLSQLLILNTRWAKQHPTKKTYEPETIFFRINNPNITTFVLFKKNSLEPIGFARLYRHQDLYYFSDFVIHPHYRGQNLGKYLLHFILSKIPPNCLITLIAGGDIHAKELYEKLGFKSVAQLYNQQQQIVEMNDGTVLMSGVIKSGPLREAMLNDFPYRNFESSDQLSLAAGVVDTLHSPPPNSHHSSKPSSDGDLPKMSI